MKSLRARLLLLILSSLFVLGAAELALRLLPARKGFGDTKVPPAGKYQHGLALRPWPDRKSVHEFRILAMGDSFTWGVGVHIQDTWPVRLGWRLKTKDPWLDFVVLNAGYPGSNTVWQAQVLTQPPLRDLDVDMVVLGFVLNDPEPSDQTERMKIYEPLARRQPEGLSKWGHEHSRLYALVWERLENTRQRREFLDYYHALFAEDSPDWLACRKALERMRDILAEREIELLVAIFPNFDSHIDHHYGYRALHEKAAEACKELGIQVLDLLPHYEGLDGRRLAVTPYTDSHPSEIAHRIAADAIYLKVRNCRSLHQRRQALQQP